MNTFLQKHGYQVKEPIRHDASTRRYSRVSKGQHTAILMQDTPGNPDITRFVEISDGLRDIGLSAPEIYDVDEAQGLMLLEDFGDTSFKSAIEQGGDVKKLYALAAEVLGHIAAQDCPLDLPDYYESAVHKNHRRVMDWYVPLERGSINADGMVDEYQKIWRDIEKSLPPCPQGFVHVDYHLENLMFLPGRDGIQQCGILDFQGAMKGPIAYDWANLLEDARTDVPQSIRDEILSDKNDDFRAHYRVLGTQFHCRVIGQFIRFALLDNNPIYLKHIPRLQNYLREGLQDPILAPLRRFFDEISVSFTVSDISNIEGIKPLISADAV